MGRPKHLLTLQGRTFLEWCLDALRGCVDEVIVSAAADQELPRLASGTRVLPDQRPLAGPLGGLASTLPNTDAEAVAVVSCDAPLVSPGLLAFLFQTLGKSDVAVACVLGGTQYFPGVYRPTMGKVAERLLGLGIHAVGAVLKDADVRLIDESETRRYDPSLSSFRNINTPDEHEVLLREFGGP